MYTMNARKINDFYRMLLFTRRALEKGGEYEKFQFSYYVLCGKISFCALWLTARMPSGKTHGCRFSHQCEKSRQSLRQFTTADSDSSPRCPSTWWIPPKLKPIIPTDSSWTPLAPCSGVLLPFGADFTKQGGFPHE